jgi:hypothetical protein
MPNPQFIQLQTDGSGKRVDASQLTVAGNTVFRQSTGIADPDDANGIGAVTNFSPTGNTYGQVVRTAPGTVDEQIILLRRMVKLLESQNAVDSGNRQRMTVDSIAAGVTLPTVTTVGTVSSISAGTITTVGAVTGITNALPAGTNAIGSVNIGGLDHRLFIDQAKVAYSGLRGRLTFN